MDWERNSQDRQERKYTGRAVVATFVYVEQKRRHVLHRISLVLCTVRYCIIFRYSGWVAMVVFFVIEIGIE